MAGLANPVPDRRGAGSTVEHIDTRLIAERLEQGQVVVAAGFQGISPEGRITTLGRGGSDTSAVALAAALQADRCDVYTDVDGVYTTDRAYAKGKKLNDVTFEEMLEMASAGQRCWKHGLLQWRCAIM